MKKNKVAFFFPNFEIGGAEKVTLNLLKELNRSYFDLSLVLREEKGDYLQKLPTDVTIVDLKNRYFLILFIKLVMYFRKERPDIFVSVFPHFSLLSILARNFSGVKTKIIIIEHSFFSRTAANARTLTRRFVAGFFFPYLMKIFYRRAETIVAISKSIADDVARIIKLPNTIKIIYNPIIGEEIYALTKEDVGHDWFSEQKIPILLAVGRFAKAKDYPTLLRAFALILQERSARLVILGDGRERKNLVNLSKSLGISKEVAFLGFQDNPYKYMARSSVFVLSSQQEGFSTVTVEAMACGLPVVSTDCQPGSREIIENGINGFLVPVGDFKSLAGAVVRLLESPSLMQKFSKEGRGKAEEFGIKKSVQEYERIFIEVSK